MMGRLRTSLHAVLASEALASVALVRIPRELARRANRTLGSPLCGPEELARRENARARLAALRSALPRKKQEKRDPVPVTIYWESGRNLRTFERMRATLETNAIPVTVCDVTGDEATLAFVTHKASCEADALPIAFVGPTVVGGYADLVAWDVDGRLHEAVYGEPAPKRAAQKVS